MGLDLSDVEKAIIALPEAPGPRAAEHIRRFISPLHVSISASVGGELLNLRARVVNADEREWFFSRHYLVTHRSLSLYLGDRHFTSLPAIDFVGLDKLEDDDFVWLKPGESVELELGSVRIDAVSGKNIPVRMRAVFSLMLPSLAVRFRAKSLNIQVRVESPMYDLKCERQGNDHYCRVEVHKTNNLISAVFSASS